ncbi:MULTISPECIES: hypothetical protein [Okeania]|nr:MULTISPECIES: hypothetical protein [Okeania]
MSKSKSKPKPWDENWEKFEYIGGGGQDKTFSGRYSSLHGD